MADASERTEQPTPFRIRKARQEGRIPQSQELPSALLVGALVVVSMLAVPALYRFFVAEIDEGLALRRPGPFDVDMLMNLFREKSAAAMAAMAPFLAGASAAGILGSVLVGGWCFAPKAVRLEWSRLVPSTGLKTLLSARSAVHLLTSLAKMAALVAILVTYLRDKLPSCLALSDAGPLGALAIIMDMLAGLGIRITVALGAIGLADWIYQRWQYQRDLRMTREEVKEERRSHEPSPLVRSRMRAVHMALVRKRMLRQVPKADVVITNPTHVAVALAYDAARMDAPQVVAKGADLLCEKIKQIARQHGVPVVERPELARTLYRTVEVGQAIPEPLYVAVAEILAMIYRLRKQRNRA